MSELPLEPSIEGRLAQLREIARVIVFVSRNDQIKVVCNKRPQRIDLFVKKKSLLFSSNPEHEIAVGTLRELKALLEEVNLILARSNSSSETAQDRTSFMNSHPILFKIRNIVGHSFSSGKRPAEKNLEDEILPGILAFEWVKTSLEAKQSLDSDEDRKKLFNEILSSLDNVIFALRKRAEIVFSLSEGK